MPSTAWTLTCLTHCIGSGGASVRCSAPCTCSKACCYDATRVIQHAAFAFNVCCNTPDLSAGVQSQAMTTFLAGTARCRISAVHPVATTADRSSNDGTQDRDHQGADRARGEGGAECGGLGYCLAMQTALGNSHLEIQTSRKRPVGILRTTFRENGRMRHTQHGRIAGCSLEQAQAAAARLSRARRSC